MNLSTPDLDAAFDRVQATGAEVIQEPMDHSYGRDCAFRDPAGNMIRIIQKGTHDDYNEDDQQARGTRHARRGMD